MRGFCVSRQYLIGIASSFGAGSVTAVFQFSNNLVETTVKPSATSSERRSV
jgi:hypothetical protein